jgi:ABC-type antimicrobial peptide transport system permease subunit
MFRNYLTAALRNLLRERTSTLLNIAGLTLGIAGSIILFLIVRNGNSYDHYHSKFDRIYRIVTESKGNNGDTFTQGVPPILSDAFRNDFPEAEEVAFTSYRRGSMVSVVQRNGQLKKYEEPTGVVFTQSSFFKIFDRPILIGSSDKGLDEPNNAIISRRWAIKYFGKEDVVGEILRYDNNDFKISAVMEDFPPTTDFPFELMLSYITIEKSMEKGGWSGISDSDNCYFLLKEGELIDKVDQRMSAFAKKYIGIGDNGSAGSNFLIQPLAEIHFDMRFGNYNKRMPQAASIAFTVIGIFLLITACINFINLTTAEVIKRTKEVGIRKALGSSRAELIIKYLLETSLVTIAAVFLAISIAQLALGFLNPFLELSLSLDVVTDLTLWGFLIFITVIVSLLSGLYPAIAVSSLRPVMALKNQVSGTPLSGTNFRKGLVVLQFFISQFFIISTIVIAEQMNFMLSQDIGFNKDAIITVPIPVADGSNDPGKMRALKNEILALPGVERATLNATPPSANSVTGTDFKIVGNEDDFKTQIKPIDGDYLEVFGVEVIAGQGLLDSDTINGLMVNERLAKIAGFDNIDEIVGKEIELSGQHLTVKGVVKDFNTTSLEKPIEPVILFTNINDFRKLSIKLKPTDIEETLLAIQAKWSQIYPEYIFSYNFLDEQIYNLYRGERKMSTLLTIFSFIAVFIGCLGLFGLVTFMANRKTKEIGLRKVLGASVQSIMLLFSKEFVKLLLIAFLIAAPAAGFMMHTVLQEFAYRIQLGPVVFLAGLSATFLIAFLTVGYRSFKSASANPVDSLRSE